MTVCEVLVAMHFVQVFVNKPHDFPLPLGLQLHTYPFTLLIIALWVMSAKNAWWFIKMEHEEEGNKSYGTRNKMIIGFEIWFFIVSLIKIIIHFNLFMGNVFWKVKDAPVSFLKAMDVLYTMTSSLAVPVAIWLCQYRIGNRVKVSFEIVKVVAGDYTVFGDKVGLGKIDPA